MGYPSYQNFQLGGGSGGVKNVYVGARFQRGHGIGGFLGGLFRGVLPYLKAGARYLGKEAFKTGLHVLEDIDEKGVGFKESLKERSKDSLKNIKRKASEKAIELMQGNGYKTASKKRRRQSTKRRSKKRNKPVKRLNNKKSKKKRSSKKKSKTKKNSQKFRKISDIFGT